MVATFEWKVYTGSGAGTENPSSGSATHLNFHNDDTYGTSTDYQTKQIVVPSSGTAYSYERWIRGRWSGTFNLIDNILFWKSAGTLSDVNLAIYAGETATGATPVVTVSSIATAAVPTTEGTAIDITPSGGISSSPGYSDYCVMQLRVPSTVTTPGDIGVQTFTMQYDES
jgi:hypothetical protein